MKLWRHNEDTTDLTLFMYDDLPNFSRRMGLLLLFFVRWFPPAGYDDEDDDDDDDDGLLKLGLVMKRLAGRQAGRQARQGC